MEMVEFIDNREKLISENEFEFKISKQELQSLVKPEYMDSKEAKKRLEIHLGILGLMNKLNVNPSYGIEESPNEIEARKKLFGENLPLIPYEKSIFSCFLEVLKDKIFLFLLFAA